MQARLVRSSLLLAGGFAALVGCSTTLPEQQPIAVSPLTFGPEEWRVADQVVIVTDASGTMYVEETFPEAKALTRSFVSAMPERSARAQHPDQYTAGLIGFGGEERELVAVGDFDRGALSRGASELDIMGSIDNRGGTTPLHQVFAEAGAALAGRRGPAAIVVLSDGRPDDPVRALAAAQALAGSYPDPVCFHAVQTGEAPEGTAFLTELAAIHGCGSLRNGADLNSGRAISDFSRRVFAGPAAPAAVSAGPCEGVIRLRGIEFEFDQYDVDGPSQVVLDAGADALRGCPNVSVNVDGHTDWIGTEEYNQGLSERRANSVTGYLAGQGVGDARLTPRGFGETQPIAPNETDDGRARNRRVELIPTP